MCFSKSRLVDMNQVLELLFLLYGYHGYIFIFVSFFYDTQVLQRVPITKRNIYLRAIHTYHATLVAHFSIKTYICLHRIKQQLKIDIQNVSNVGLMFMLIQFDIIVLSCVVHMA